MTLDFYKGLKQWIETSRGMRSAAGDSQKKMSKSEVGPELSIGREMTQYFTAK